MLLGESSSSDDDVARAASAHAAAHPQPKRPCHEADRVRACAEARFDVEHELNDQVLRAACATPANAPKRSAPVQQAQLRVQLDESSDEDCPISRAANAHANKPSSAAGSTKTESAVAVARLDAEREAGIVRDRERREEAVDRAAHVHENANLREWISHMREEISESCERFEASGNEVDLAGAIDTFHELAEDDGVDTRLRLEVQQSIVSGVTAARQGLRAPKMRWKATCLGSLLALIYCGAGPQVTSLVQRAIGGPEAATIAGWRQDELRLKMGTSQEIVAWNWDKVVWPALVELGYDDCLLGMGECCSFFFAYSELLMHCCTTQVRMVPLVKSALISWSKAAKPLLRTE